jgi:hypothetical protein
MSPSNNNCSDYNSDVSQIQKIVIDVLESKFCKSNAHHVIQNIINKRDDFDNNKINKNDFIDYLIDIKIKYS